MSTCGYLNIVWKVTGYALCVDSYGSISHKATRRDCAGATTYNDQFSEFFFSLKSWSFAWRVRGLDFNKLKPELCQQLGFCDICGGLTYSGPVLSRKVFVFVCGGEGGHSAHPFPACALCSVCQTPPYSSLSDCTVSKNIICTSTRFWSSKDLLYFPSYLVITYIFTALTKSER